MNSNGAWIGGFKAGQISVTREDGERSGSGIDWENFITIFWTTVLGILGSIVGGGVTHMFSRPTNERYHRADLIFSTLGAKLGIPRQTLESKIRSFGIDKHRFRTL